MEKIKTGSLSHQYLPIWVQEGRELVFDFNLHVWGSNFIFKCVSKPDVKYFLFPLFFFFFLIFQSSNDVFPWVPRSACGIGETCRSLRCVFSQWFEFSFQVESQDQFCLPPRDYIMANVCRSIPSLQQEDLQVSGETWMWFWGYFWCFWGSPEHLHSGETSIEWSVLLTTGLRWSLMSFRETQDGKGWKGSVGSSAPSSLPHAGCAPDSSQVSNSFFLSSSSCSPLASPWSIWPSKMKCGREGPPNQPLPTAPNYLADFWSHQLPVWGDQAAEAFIDGEDVAWACQELCWG